MSAQYLVAIFGGAVSGAEAAYQLSQKGIESVVFDQNTLPFGKIEDGLPKWHAKLRDKEEAAIIEKLSHSLVHFVPNTRLGRDIEFEDVAKHWGFSAVMLAIGAWRDRPLPVEGVEEYVGKGLIYQNPFIYWFNHKHEPGFEYADAYSIEPGAIVIGGGLASLDVVKVLMIESVQQALVERGVDVNLFDLDRSIAKVLHAHDLSLEDLGVEPCTLFYRRRIQDMPLSPLPTDTPEQLAKAERVREKILGNYQSKYLFKMVPNRMPVDKIVENGRLVGLVMQESVVVNGRVKPVEGAYHEVRGPYVISSIGSIPEPIPGIPGKGSAYDIADESCCRLAGYSNVFALGNAVTGRGNIKESLRHGQDVSLRVAAYIEDPLGADAIESIRANKEAVADTFDGLGATIEPIETARKDAILDRIRSMQEARGYNGDFRAWVAKHTPVRLEELVGGH